MATQRYPLRLQFRNVGNLSRSIRRCSYGVINRLVDDEGQVSLMQNAWNAEYKLRNLSIKAGAIFCDKKVTTFHGARRRL
jgi:hypothetical protein